MVRVSLKLTIIDTTLFLFEVQEQVMAETILGSKDFAHSKKKLLLIFMILIPYFGIQVPK
jgi:hypothetical protein